MDTEEYKHIELLERATQAMERFGKDRPIVFNLNIGTTASLIGVVQLALRHPEAGKSGSMKIIDGMIRQLIEQIDPEHGDLYQFFMMGFDPECDV